MSRTMKAMEKFMFGKSIPGLAPVFVMGCMVIALGCGRKAGDAAQNNKPAVETEQSITVDARRAVEESLEITLDAVGTLEAAEDVWLTTEAAGMVKEILFEEGAPVEKGRVLVLLDDDMVQLEKAQAEKRIERLSAGLTRGAAEVRRAQSQEENAQNTFQRKEELFQQGAATRATYLDAKTEYDSALAALDEAKAALEETGKSIGEAEAGLRIAEERIAQARVPAPFDGILGERRVGPGDYVDLGQEIVRLVAMNPLKATFNLPERYRNRVSMGQEVSLAVEAWPGQTFRGEVVYIAPSLDPETRTIRLKAVLENEAGKLKPGFFCRVRLIVEVNPKAVMIPEEAVIPRGEDFFIYKIEMEKALLARVELGQRLAGRVEARCGVSKGDLVITAGHHRVADGTPVVIRKSSNHENDTAGTSQEQAGREQAGSGERSASQ
ncbi:MAG: efflux RND transporter periplasmic adaptor subunit [Planctomycetes bacterium]|nr:efflux RND transporter periplasmic adaptor subunit [Planctomycetota bacterium]